MIWLAVVVIFVVGGCIPEEIPEFIHVCQKDEPDMQRCFITAGEHLKPHFVTGVPEYDIPSLEPLIIDDLVSYESSGLHITSTNVKAWGCSDFTIRSVNINMNTQKYEISVELPQIRIESDYSVDGTLLVLPLKGNGLLEANITDCKSTSILQGELYDKDGEIYLRFVSMTMKVEIGGGHVHISNLFGGDKRVGDLINDIVNKNLAPFLRELLPIIENALTATFLDVSNKIVERFTFKQLFPH